MRFLVPVMAIGVLGCCLGPSVDAPPASAPAPAAPSPLSQALQGMGVSGDGSASAPANPSGAAPAAPAAPGVAAPPAAPVAGAGMTAPPPATPAATPAATQSASTGTSAVDSSPACAEARAARETVRAQLAELRMTLGAATSARLEAAGQAMMACNADTACLGNGKERVARIDAYDRAKAAHEGETRRLAEAEVGLFEADRRVAAACGAP